MLLATQFGQLTTPQWILGIGIILAIPCISNLLKEPKQTPKMMLWRLLIEIFTTFGVITTT